MICYRRSARLATSALVTCCALSCTDAVRSTLHSSGDESSRTSWACEAGQAYFLPQTAIQLDLSIKLKKEAQALCDAQADAHANKTCGEKYKDRPTDIAACEPVEKQKELKTCVDAISDVGDFDVKLGIEAKRVPDGSRLYRLDHCRNWMSDDDLKVEIDGEGFLRSVSGRTIDRTGEAIEKVASIGINVAKFLSAAAEAQPGCTLKVLKGQYRFVRTLAEVQRSPGATDRFNVGACADALTLHAEALGTYKAADAISPADGVVVTIPQPYRLESVLQLADARSEAQLYAALPDGAPTFVVPVRRTYFGSVDHEVKISQGMLTSVQIDRPSPIVAFFDVPLRITERLVSLPTELIQLKYDGPTKAAELEKKLVDAQLALEKSQKELDEARQQETAAEVP